MTDKWETFENELGVWEVKGNVERLVTPSQKWHDKNPPQEPEPQPPTDIELLQQENAMLQMSVMEMTMYAATQDVRLQGQEQAILELSMIVAGGGL